MGARPEARKPAVQKLDPRMNDLTFIGALHSDLEGWRIMGRITSKYPVKEITTKDQRKMQVLSFIVLGRDNF